MLDVMGLSGEIRESKMWLSKTSGEVSSDHRLDLPQTIDTCSNCTFHWHLYHTTFVSLSNYHYLGHPHIPSYVRTTRRPTHQVRQFLLA